MICVSYTRAVSEKKELPSIPEQNRMIADFVKKKGLTIEKKYSDRKQDPEAEDGFFEMKADGISRKYDCVVFLSLDSFGKNLMFGYDVLFRAFAPAGIHFASVKDQFCSFEVSRNEIDDFLNRKLRQYRDEAHPVGIRYYQGVSYDSTTKYGYLRVEGENKLVIDPVAEPVVREIFKLASEGMTYTKISDLLHERGVETCTHRVNELTGKTTNAATDRWRNRAVERILRDRVYSGKWKTRVDGEMVILDCPAYLAPEEQDRILAQIKRRTCYGRSTNVLSRFVYDKHSGDRLQPRQSGKYDNHMVYLFFDPQKHLKYRSITITFQEMTDLVVKRILEEKRATQGVVQFLVDTEEGKAFEKEKLKEYYRRAKTLFAELQGAALEMPVCEEEQDNEKTKLVDQLAAQYEALFDEYESQRVLFSTDNPWIKLYATFDSSTFTTAKIVRKYLEGVYCDRYGNIDIRLKEQEARSRFPIDVITGEERDGEKE